MNRLIGILLALLVLGTSSAGATPPAAPAAAAADLSYWGLDQGPPYVKLIFYQGGVPWLGWVGEPIYYEWDNVCTQNIKVFVPECTGCASTCLSGHCRTAIVEGVANGQGVYRVLRFTSGDEWFGSDPIPYNYDAKHFVLYLTLPYLCQ